jgi:hypothetical protein
MVARPLHSRKSVWEDTRVPGVAIKSLTRHYGDVAAVDDSRSTSSPASWWRCSALGLRQDDDPAPGGGFLKPESGEIWVGDRCLSSPAAWCRRSGAGWR